MLGRKIEKWAFFVQNISSLLFCFAQKRYNHIYTHTREPTKIKPREGETANHRLDYEINILYLKQQYNNKKTYKI
jgi:hypothetical protein